MATRSTAVGSKSSADYLTASNYNDGAGGLIGYAYDTTGMTGITTAVDITWSSLTAPSTTLTLTPNSSRILRISYNFVIGSNTANDTCKVLLFKDAANIDNRWHEVGTPDKLGTAAGAFLDRNPTNASHAYKLQIQRSASSTGTFTINNGAAIIGVFLIEDIGPSF